MKEMISVIIPVRDDLARLRECVACLLAEPNRERLGEILIVDNGSAAPISKEWDATGRVRVLRCEGGGSYAARNAALEAASGTVLAFTDSDCMPAADWLESGLRALDDSACDIAAGRVEVFPQDPARPTAVECYEMIYAFPQAGYVAHEHFGVTANLFVRRAVFEAVGSFNAELYSGGDREWGRRAHDAGFLLLYAETAVVRHPARRTWAELRKKFDRVAQGLRDSGVGSENACGLTGWFGALRRAAGCVIHPRGHALTTRVKSAWIVLRLHACIRR